MAAGLQMERNADPANALDAALAMRAWLGKVAASRGIDISMRAGVHNRTGRRGRDRELEIRL
jgi:hypothetical protein